MIKTLIHGLSDLVYPPLCLLCRRSRSSADHQEILCPRCAPLILLNEPPFCVRCTRPFAKSPHTRLCHSCRNNDLHFDFAWCALRFNDNLKRLLYKYKFHDRMYLSRFFYARMRDFLRSFALDTGQFDCCCPVPLSFSRRRERGYNQAALLARHFSDDTSVPLAGRLLLRTRETPPQSATRAKNRWTNVEGAFTINPNSDVNGKSILVVDDLLTTGATVSSVAFELKKAGASRVGVLALAAVPDVARGRPGL